MKHKLKFTVLIVFFGLTTFADPTELKSSPIEAAPIVTNMSQDAVILSVCSTAEPAEDLNFKTELVDIQRIPHCTEGAQVVLGYMSRGKWFFENLHRPSHYLFSSHEAAARHIVQAYRSKEVNGLFDRAESVSLRQELDRSSDFLVLPAVGGYLVGSSLTGGCNDGDLSFLVKGIRLKIRCRAVSSRH
ncbi:MAG: hypothetical protein R2827_13730 [Bdellovibrionales bacterium]